MCIRDRLGGIKLHLTLCHLDTPWPNPEGWPLHELACNPGATPAGVLSCTSAPVSYTHLTLPTICSV
eukprot:187607-Alexandrium_andersonii.AAC.1